MHDKRTIVHRLYLYIFALFIHTVSAECESANVADWCVLLVNCLKMLHLARNRKKYGIFCGLQKCRSEVDEGEATEKYILDATVRVLDNH